MDQYYHKDKWPEWEQDFYADYYLKGSEYLIQNGFPRYGISNFAKEGRESKHNQLYWNHNPYLGFGPGAHSYVPPRDRYSNDRHLNKWKIWIQEDGCSPLNLSKEILNLNQINLEKFWLQFRQAKGVILDEWLLNLLDQKLLNEYLEKNWI